MYKEFIRDFLTVENKNTIEKIRDVYKDKVNIRYTDSTSLKDVIQLVKNDFNNTVYTFWNISSKKSNLTHVSMNIPQHVLDEVFPNPTVNDGTGSIDM